MYPQVEYPSDLIKSDPIIDLAFFYPIRGLFVSHWLSKKKKVMHESSKAAKIIWQGGLKRTALRYFQLVKVITKT